MTDLNGSYLKHRYPTDVLSFQLGEHEKKIDGEIYINLDQAKRQARAYKVSFCEEFSRLTIHGLLHLLGYRDNTARKKALMTKKENLFLSI